MKFVTFIILAGTLINACATTVNAEKTVDFDIKVGPPCSVVVRADGEIVSTTRGPAPCNIVVTP